MIKEFVKFTKNLDEDFRNLGIKSREGLHIILKMQEIDGLISLDLENIEYQKHTKKMEETIFIEKCKFLALNSWCIDTNKCFDLPTKAIHSCSPYCVAFKREHLDGGEKYAKNKQEKKKQIDERFGDYFAKSFLLLETDEEKQKYEVFKAFFTQKQYEPILQKIENEAEKPLADADYIIFYLDESLEQYKKVHQKYLSDRLFNTAAHNTKPNVDNEIFGTSSFFNGFNQSMPFLTHQTATFDISGRISESDANVLYEFEQILARGILPKPLPIFVFKEELQQEVIKVFKDSDSKFGYKEIINEVWAKCNGDFGNYYLLFYINTKDGIVFKDFDFVTQFQYELTYKEEKKWTINNLFGLTTEKNSKELKPSVDLRNIFDLEFYVFNVLVGSKYKKIDYFNDLDTKGYEKMENTFLAYTKYRKAIYDFVYKSKRNSIQENAFSEMVFNGIKDDLKADQPFQIKNKLNIWFSLYEKFNLNNNFNLEKTMASKLKEYQQFVDELAKNEANINDVSPEKFAFAAGQVIYYIFTKSKSEESGYQRLEPYLRQSNTKEFKKAIANDFAKYKHENYSNKFKNVASFVLTYMIDDAYNLKNLLPEILAGIFAEQKLFGDKSNSEKNIQN